MEVQIINFGRSRVVPTCQGEMFIDNLPFPTKMDLQKQAAEEIDAQHDMKVIFPKIEHKKVEQRKIDYSEYRINELRSMAANKKILGSFTMKKAVLIKKLEEENGTKIR